MDKSDLGLAGMGAKSAGGPEDVGVGAVGVVPATLMRRLADSTTDPDSDSSKLAVARVQVHG